MFKEKYRTERGFGKITFDDLYNNECSIQESSLATDCAIWFGINDANPQTLKYDIGLPPNGYIKYLIPKEVHLTTRMHLNKQQVAQLIPILQKFVETGELDIEE